MKYIIIGLGNFGASLSQKLTEQGNEVIGIDINMQKVDAYKEKITHTIRMDATDEFTVTGLPLNDTDIVMVTIGEDQGANIMATALLKKFKVNRLISRAINPLHEKVLNALGVDEIVHPEEETAERWSKKLCIPNVIDSFEINDEYSVIEVKVPSKFEGKIVEDVRFRDDYNLMILSVIKKIQVKSILGKTKSEKQIKGLVTEKTLLEKEDILILYGTNKKLQSFLKK